MSAVRRQEPAWLDSYDLTNAITPSRYAKARAVQAPRDMLCNPYCSGKIRLRGISVRQKRVSYRCAKPKIIQGQHEPIVSDELWRRSQQVRASRRRKVKTVQKTSRIRLLQGLVVCAHCGRQLRAQNPKKRASFYREESHYRGFEDCPVIGKSVRAEIIDARVADLVQSLKLPDDWEQEVREMLQDQDDDRSIEAERRDLRTTLRLMRENYERRMYEGEEFIYWLFYVIPCGTYSYLL